MQELKITIDAKGQVRVEVQGVVGAGCLELTRQLEEKLGGKVQEREFKDVFYQPQLEVESQSTYSTELNHQ